MKLTKAAYAVFAFATKESAEGGLETINKTTGFMGDVYVPGEED